VDGLLKTIKKGAVGTFHFSVPSEKTVAEIVNYVCQSMGFSFDRATKVVGERLGQDANYTLDCTKAIKELGWKPRISFEEGVKETVQWIETSWDQVQKEPLVYVHKN
jgi:dTDP-glucose 4,6-dehydratase